MQASIFDGCGAAGRDGQSWNPIASGRRKPGFGQTSPHRRWFCLDMDQPWLGHSAGVARHHRSALLRRSSLMNAVPASRVSVGSNQVDATTHGIALE
jgi:hypothetical protein